MKFKCVWHEEDDPILGPASPLTFGSVPQVGQYRPPEEAICPKDGLVTRFRICPNCHRDLPYYVGRAPQRIISITGCQGSGKTVYLWGVLYQIREKLSRDPRPYTVAMFEDDASYQFFHTLSEAILRRRKMPEATLPSEALQGEIRPVIVRLLRERRRDMCNLIFYDHAGELVEAMSDVAYLRYLAHSSAILFLVDSASDEADRPSEQATSLAAVALGNICKYIREEAGLSKRTRIPKLLAIVLTKADRSIFTEHPSSRLISGHGDSQSFWKRWGRAHQAELDQASQRCERLAREMGLNNLINIATLNFVRVRTFAVSSLGKSLRSIQANGAPEPLGVENPLFWAMNG
jgi:hypothetical protein